MVVSESTLSPAEGFLPGGNAVESDLLGDNLKNQEFKLILDALTHSNGSRKNAAEKLGISQRTLRYKLAKMRDIGMDVPAAYGN